MNHEADWIGLHPGAMETFCTLAESDVTLTLAVDKHGHAQIRAVDGFKVVAEKGTAEI